MIQADLGWALLAIVAVQFVTGVAMAGVGHRNLPMHRVLPYLVSGTAGVLLATACLDLLPEAVHAAHTGAGLWVVLLATLLTLFCVQASAQWFADKAVYGRDAPDHAHAHSPWEESHPTHRGDARKASPGTLLLGSGLHSLVDGVAIAAAFAAGWRPGWSVTLAVCLHELPHRLGDFALLLHMGVRKQKAASAAVLAGASALLGGLAVAGFGHSAANARWLLPVSAGSFLYIALVDLLPEMQATRRAGNLGWQLLCLCGGAVLMAMVVQLGGDRP